jgi:hypothetical protein
MSDAATPDEAWLDILTRPMIIPLAAAASYTVAKEEFMEEFDIRAHEDIEAKLGADFARFINRMDEVGKELVDKHAIAPTRNPFEGLI